MSKKLCPILTQSILRNPEISLFSQESFKEDVKGYFIYCLKDDCEMWDMTSGYCTMRGKK